MKLVVGIADMKISHSAGDIIVTHALGSCIGVAINDPVAKVGGILHFMLPQSSVNPAKAKLNPYMFADTGLPSLFLTAFKMGASKKNLIIKLAGGAQVSGDSDFFAVGERNRTHIRKILSKNNLLITAEDVGGHASRTLYLEVGTGRSWIYVQGREVAL